MALEFLPLKANENLTLLLSQSVETALKLTNVLVEVNFGKVTKTFTTHSACVDCDLSIPDLTPRDFSFNAPNGACKDCHGLGVKHSFDIELLAPDRNLSVSDGAIKALNKIFDY